MTNKLKIYYTTEVIPKLEQQFHYFNKHQIPKILKIEINRGLGLLAKQKEIFKKSINEISSISGQYPKITRTKKSISGFKIHKDEIIGLKVTLRGEKMYSFLERLINLSLPCIRDFQGLNISNFDKNGNYNFGINDQLIFPEINFDSVDNIFGFNISIYTTSRTKEESYFLLKSIGLPFKKE